MYPAYKRADVLDEYAITFFSLLNEGYRIRWKNYLMLAHIGDLPQSSKESRRQFYKQLDWATKDADDILSVNNKGDDIAQLKKLLG